MTEEARKAQEEAKVSWVYELVKEDLVTELVKRDLNAIGTVAVLRERLVQAVRGLETSKELPTSDTATLSGNSTPGSSKVIPMDVVRKWNVKFTGEESVEAFLERVEELRLGYLLTDAQILVSLPELFKGHTLLWLRNNKEQWSSWAEFVVVFRERFLPPDYEELLEEEIRLRTQGEDETVADFVNAQQTLMRRLPVKLSSAGQVKRICRNLRPDVRMHLRGEEVASIGSLIKKGMLHEQFVKDMANYKAPPHPSKAFVPETAYGGKGRKGQPQHEIAALSPGPPAGVSTIKGCWNCGQLGHRFGSCPVKERKLFCYRCGHTEVTMKTCPCSKNVERV